MQDRSIPTAYHIHKMTAELKQCSESSLSIFKNSKVKFWYMCYMVEMFVKLRSGFTTVLKPGTSLWGFILKVQGVSRTHDNGSIYVTGKR